MLKQYCSDTADIYDEWDRIKQIDEYREAYAMATEICNKIVRERKRKEPEKDRQLA